MRFKIVLTAAVMAALAGASVASAHVRLDPAKVPAGSFSRFVVRVPTEEPTAATVKVSVQLPLGLAFVNFQPKPGWKRTVTLQKLKTPLKLFGETITERIATVAWTSAGAKIAPGEFDEFGMTAAMPAKAGLQLSFPAVQTYSNGKVVRWIGPADAELPAPVVALGPAVADHE